MPLAIAVLLSLLPQTRYLLVGSERSTLKPRQQALLMLAVAAELQKYDGVEVARLSHDAPVSLCADDQPACYARLIGLAQADAALVVRLVRIEQTDALTLTALDAGSGEATQLITRTGDNALDAVGPAVGELLIGRVPSATPGVELAWRDRWRVKPVPWPVFVSGVAITLTAISVGAAFAVAGAAWTQQENALVNPMSSATQLATAVRINASTNAGNDIGLAGALLTVGIITGITTLVLAFFTDFGSDRSWRESTALRF
jgi:hypothetical protein